jgi:hypothetical protein
MRPSSNPSPTLSNANHRGLTDNPPNENPQRAPHNQPEHNCRPNDDENQYNQVTHDTNKARFYPNSMTQNPKSPVPPMSRHSNRAKQSPYPSQTSFRDNSNGKQIPACSFLCSHKAPFHQHLSTRSSCPKSPNPIFRSGKRARRLTNASLSSHKENRPTYNTNPYRQMSNKDMTPHYHLGSISSTSRLWQTQNHQTSALPQQNYHRPILGYKQHYRTKYQPKTNNKTRTIAIKSDMAKTFTTLKKQYFFAKIHLSSKI